VFAYILRSQNAYGSGRNDSDLLGEKEDRLQTARHRTDSCHGSALSPKNIKQNRHRRELMKEEMLINQILSSNGNDPRCNDVVCCFFCCLRDELSVAADF
jgi:hypothetical protein